MKVEALDSSKDIELINFLDELSLTSISVLGYHYPFYRNMLQQIQVGTPLYLGLFDNDKLLAVLPGFIKSTPAGNVYSSMPFFGPNAGILCAEDEKTKYAPIILVHLIEFLKENEFISASIYSSFFSSPSIESNIFSPMFPLEVKKFTSYISMPDLFISNKVLYDIRKAEKEGVTISTNVTSEKVDKLFEIYHQNCEDFKIPEKPKACIEFLAAEAKSSENISFYFAEIDGKLIGGLIMIWSKSVASYYLPCSLNEYRSIQPNTLLIAHALNVAKEKRIKIWNWESSPDKESGVYKFKKKWGSSDGEYSIFIRNLKDTNFFKVLGKKGLSTLFKYFFVYPFDKLEIENEISTTRN